MIISVPSLSVCSGTAFCLFRSRCIPFDVLSAAVSCCELSRKLFCVCGTLLVPESVMGTGVESSLPFILDMLTCTHKLFPGSH